MPSAACLMLKSSHACSALVSCASVSRNQKSSRFVQNAISAVRRLCGLFALLQTDSERLLPREFHGYKLESQQSPRPRALLQSDLYRVQSFAKANPLTRF